MAKYKGKTVTLNKPRAIRKGSPGYGTKRKEVFVKNPSSGKIKRKAFGDAKLGMHKNDPKRKRSYCKRSEKLGNDRMKANYWARRDWDC